MAFDIVLVGDPRFPGGTSTAMAAEIEALAAAGYRIGMIAQAAPVLRYPHPVHPALARLRERGAFTLVPPDEKAEARLALLHHPQVFAHLPRRPWRLTAREVRVIVHHPPRDAAGQIQYDWRIVDAHVADLVGPALWAPVGPKVREAFRGLSAAPALTGTDWPSVIDVRSLAVERAGFVSGRPAVGRHSRPDPAKWPDDRATFLAAYPAARDIDVRLMGFGPDQAALIGALPTNWEVFGFGAMPVRRFLGRIDFFAYYHGSRWIEAFGRSVLEAMASGAVPVLPKDFEPLFGEGAIYAAPAEVAGRVRSLHGDARAMARAQRRATAVARERFGPEVAVARIRALIGPPAGKGRPRAAPRPAARIVFFTSNGVGMGHLTRALAVARRLPPAVRPLVVTMSKAFAVCRADGIASEYLTYHRSVGMDHEVWQGWLDLELTEVLRRHRPSVFVFDGNVPYPGLRAALARFPAIWKVWERRGMWAPGAGAQHVEHEAAFDAVLEPGELAGGLDRGLTAEHRDRTVEVGPVRYLRDGEAPRREAARAALGLPAEATAVLVQLGAENNFDLSAVRDLVARTLAERPEIRLFLAEWLIREGEDALPPGTERLRDFPLVRHFAAFDFAVATAGYNTFHETLEAGLPTLFVPNEHPEQDEQGLRARYASLRGLALVARRGDPYAVVAGLEALLDPERRAAMRQAMAAARAPNGADAAAAFLAGVALIRR